MPHRQLGSAARDREHSAAIAETILGDCFAAIAYAEGRPMERQGHTGYHDRRRFDLLGLRPPEEAEIGHPKAKTPW